MMVNKRYITLILLVFSLNLFSQEKVKVITAVAENNNGIIVKWYGKHIFTSNAVNVFRTKTGSENWEKINTIPIKKQTKLPQELLDKDEAFEVIKNSIDNSKPEDLNGFLILIVMIKSVEYPAFADYLGIQFLDKTAIKGQSYKYKVVTTENKTLGISDAIAFSNFAPLNAPDSGKLDVKNKIPMISWQPDENKYFGYYVYRTENNGSVFKRISDQPIIVTKDKQGNYPKYNFVDDTMNIGDVYHYQIVGIDYFGRESKKTKTLTAIIKDVTPPPPPSTLKATVRGKHIQLFWQTTNAPDLAGYNIYRSTLKDTGYQKVNTTLIDKKYQIFNDTASRVGVLYYKVSTVDTCGNEAFSFIETAEIRDVFPPATPTKVICKADTGKITIQWQPNTESDLQGYLVYRTVNKNDAAKFLLLNKKPVKTNTYVDILPKEAKNKFFYKVVAIDTSSNRSNYSSFAVTSMPDIIPPKKPVIKSATVVDKHIRIEWFPDFDNDLAGYNIYRSAKNDTTNQNKKLNINPIAKDVTLFTDIFAKQGIEYTYTVEAFDTSGNHSDLSDGFSMTIPKVNKNDLAFANFKASSYKGKKQVKLAWKIKRIDNIKGYIIYRKEGGNTPLKPLTGLISQVEYIDKDIKNNTSYSYQIRAFTKNNLIIKSAEKTVSINIEPK